MRRKCSFATLYRHLAKSGLLVKMIKINWIKLNHFPVVQGLRLYASAAGVLLIYSTNIGWGPSVPGIGLVPMYIIVNKTEFHTYIEQLSLLLT